MVFVYDRKTSCQAKPRRDLDEDCIDVIMHQSGCGYLALTLE